MQYFDPFFQFRRFKRCCAKRKGANSTMTQAEANTLYEGTTLMMANRWANTANLILTTIFYFPIIPSVSLFCVLGLIGSYWANKYVLLRRNKVPEQASGMMA